MLDRKSDIARPTFFMSDFLYFSKFQCTNLAKDEKRKISAKLKIPLIEVYPKDLFPIEKFNRFLTEKLILLRKSKLTNLRN